MIDLVRVSCHNMIGLRLYSRPGCHLWEVAAALLDHAGGAHKAEIINIEDDLDLLRRYHLRIPVLQRQDTHAELFWPFDEMALAVFVKDAD